MVDLKVNFVTLVILIHAVTVHCNDGLEERAGRTLTDAEMKIFKKWKVCKIVW